MLEDLGDTWVRQPTILAGSPTGGAAIGGFWGLGFASITNDDG